jgi:hypothetical protein
MTSSCAICGGPARLWGEAIILRRHQARYLRCDLCGFIWVEDPFWLAEAYGDALSDLDVGAVSRNLRAASRTQAVIRRFFDPGAKFIDYGAGAGLFVRLMRDAGFDFRWSDKYAANVFARGFEAEAGKHELMTAFEVLEHLQNPLIDIQSMLAWSDNILFSTVLLPAATPQPGQWWYYGLEHGQHLAFYTRETLQALARRFERYTCSAGELHVLSVKPISESQFQFLTRPRVAALFNRLTPRVSLTDSDYQLLRQRLR